MSTLAEAQVGQFERDGYLFLEGALPADILKVLNDEFEAWVEESRSHSEPYGLTFDGRPRFDLEPGHSAERPGLRRISSPTELSDSYLSVMRSSIHCTSSTTRSCVARCHSRKPTEWNFCSISSTSDSPIPHALAI